MAVKEIAQKYYHVLTHDNIIIAAQHKKNSSILTQALLKTFVNSPLDDTDSGSSKPNLLKQE